MKTKQLIIINFTAVIFAAFLTVLCYSASAQGVSISPSGTPPDPSAILDISSNTGGILIPRMTEAERNSIFPAATGLMIYQTDGTTGFWYFDGYSWVQAIGPAGADGATGPTGPAGASSGGGRYVGELYGGGVVFHVDGSGGGLIASMIYPSTSFKFSNVNNVLIGTTNLWDGAGNTAKIINQPGHTESAAKICDDYINADYGTGVHSDWFLPAFTQLELMLQSRPHINRGVGLAGAGTGIVMGGFHWSSSEYTANWGYYWHYSNELDHYDNKTTSYRVRCIRAF